MVSGQHTEVEGLPMRRRTRALATRFTGIALVTAVVTALCPTGTAAAQDAAFTIGAKDTSAAEFALGPNGWEGYAQAFPNDADVTVGTDDPREALPYIHPGPVDAWAGRKPHTLTLRATLTEAQVASSYLTVHYLDTHDGAPPRLDVTVNGTVFGSRQLPKGSGRGYLGAEGTIPSTTKIFVPSAVLTAGENVFTLTHSAGSWAVYDAIELVPAGDVQPGITIDSVTPTVLFVTKDDSERQLADVSITNDGEATEATFTAEQGGTTHSTTLTVPPGSSTQRIEVPPAPGPDPARLTVSASPGNNELTMPLPYQRRWEFHIDHGSHLDIGYTGMQSEVQKQQNEFLDQAVTGCEQTKDYPDEAKFRWGIESMWVLDNYVAERPQSQLDRLAACIRSGQIEITASYDNNLHDLQTAEQMVRMIYPGAKKYEERFDTDVVTAFENDSPAVSWQYVQALHKSGVKYLVVGHNATRAPHSPQSTKPGLFWWEAANGDRVLTWYTSPDTNYTEGYGLFPGGNPTADFGQSVSNIDARLRTVQETGYDKDLYMAMFRLDNIPAQPGLSDFAKQFNETYSSPKVVVSTPSRFFGEVEQQGTEALPVNRGDWTDWWVDGAGSSARETAMTRDAQDRTGDAETLGALGGLSTPDDGTLEPATDEAYRQAELYTEHTWGASGPTWDDPQWPVKRAFAEEADRRSRETMTDTLSQLGGQVDNPTGWPAAAVFNAQSWARDGLATVTVPEGRLGSRPFRLYHGDREIPYELVSRQDGQITLRFVAHDVPALGYRTYGLRPAEPDDRGGGGTDLRVSERGMENEFYRLRLDETTGTIVSIVDKQTGRELVDQDSPYAVNQFLYRPNDAGSNKWNDKLTSDRRQWTPTDAAVRVVSSGPVTATLEITHSTGAGGDVTGVKGLTERITLTAGIPRIDIANTVDKTRVETAEEAYYAFPFEVDDPDVRYEIPAAQVRFFDDQMPGAAMDWQAIGRYADVSNSGGGVLFSAPSAPMVEFDHVRTQEWVARPGRLDGGQSDVDPADYEPTNGSIFSYTHNNLWGTNYRIAQEGPVTFRYSIGSHDRGSDPVRSTRFGAEVHSPLHAVGVAQAQRGPFAHKGSLVSVDRSGVTVQTVKRADDGAPGIAVRLLEVAGRDGATTVTLPFEVGAAQLADATERTQKPLSVKGNTVRVPVEARGIVTVLVQPKVSLTARADAPVVARGETVPVAVQLRNDSTRPVSGSVRLTGPADVTVEPASVPVAELAPGQAFDAAFTVSVPAGTSPGELTLTAAADLGQASAVPATVTLDVVDPVEVLATPSELDLVEGVAAPLEVTLTNNLPRLVAPTVRVAVPDGWTATGDTTVSLGAGESRTVPLAVTAPAGAFGTDQVRVNVSGDVPDTTRDVAAAVSRPVVTVGAPDGGTGEFALSPAGYGDYADVFRDGATFTAGDDPRTGWPYIQPGPQDDWAGSRDHPATFRFTLPEAPSGDLTFTAWLLDTNNIHTGYLRVDVNGAEGTAYQLPLGGGDGYHWGDGQPNRYGGIRPSTVNITLPASQLHAGENVLTISRPAGSWIVYDAFGVRQLP
jgi:alpha-mannosidase